MRGASQTAPQNIDGKGGGSQDHIANIIYGFWDKCVSMAPSHLSLSAPSSSSRVTFHFCEQFHIGWNFAWQEGREGKVIIPSTICVSNSLMIVLFFCLRIFDFYLWFVCTRSCLAPVKKDTEFARWSLLIADRNMRDSTPPDFSIL